LTIPAAELSRLQVGSGDESVAVTLGILGFLGGTAAYFSFCSHNTETCRHDIEDAQQDTTNTLQLPSLYVVSAFGAALLGGAIGEALSPQRWNNVDQPLHLGFVPTRHGIMLVGSYELGGRRRARGVRQSERSATRGSILVARNAGSTLARSAMPNSIAVTATNVVASVDVTP
jgi:hypothetical protein